MMRHEHLYHCCAEPGPDIVQCSAATRHTYQTLHQGANRTVWIIHIMSITAKTDLLSAALKFERRQTSWNPTQDFIMKSYKDRDKKCWTSWRDWRILNCSLITAMFEAFHWSLYYRDCKRWQIVLQKSICYARYHKLAKGEFNQI